MSDGYDLFCFQKITEAMHSVIITGDEVTCACANYLTAEGYDAHTPLSLANASRIIPTTNNI